jgi:hypothetical protein
MGKTKINIFLFNRKNTVKRNKTKNILKTNAKQTLEVFFPHPFQTYKGNLG